MVFLGAEAPPSAEVPPSTTALPLPMASLAGASAIWVVALSCVACSPATASSVEAPESTSMAEGPDASLACDLVGADIGWTLGVTGAMAGDAWGEASRCNISLMFLEAPKVLEVFFKLVVAFFLKRTKSISTGVRQTMDNVGEKEAYTRGGALEKGIAVTFLFSASRVAVVFLEAPPSTLRLLLLLSSVDSVRGGALPLSRQRDLIVGHDGEFLHLWIIDFGSHAVLIYIP